MAFEIEITKTAEKRLSRFDKEIQRHFFSKITRLGENPKSGKPLRNELHGTWEIYFERKFRILYQIDDKQNKIIITGIKHKDEF